MSNAFRQAMLDFHLRLMKGSFLPKASRILDWIMPCALKEYLGQQAIKKLKKLGFDVEE